MKYVSHWTKICICLTMKYISHFKTIFVWQPGDELIFRLSTMISSCSDLISPDFPLDFSETQPLENFVQHFNRDFLLSILYIFLYFSFRVFISSCLYILYLPLDCTYNPPSNTLKRLKSIFLCILFHALIVYVFVSISVCQPPPPPPPSLSTMCKKRPFW